MKQGIILSIVFLMLVLGVRQSYAHGGYNVLSPDDPVMSDPDDGNWFEDEAPQYCIDGDSGTKFLHFRHHNGNVGIRVTPQELKVVQGLRLTTANDAPDRDPVYYEVYGSNVSLEADEQDWTLLSEGPVTDFIGENWPRFTPNETPLMFSNDTAYAHYRVMFPQSAGGDGLGLMQISVIELLAFTDDVLFYIAGQPQDIYAIPGTDVDIEVDAYNDYPENLEYQWFMTELVDEDDLWAPEPETFELSDGGNISGTNTAVLTIANVSYDDQADYFCVVTDTATGETIQSSDARLNVRVGYPIGESSTQQFTDPSWVLPESVFYAMTLNSDSNSVQGVYFTEWTDGHPFQVQRLDNSHNDLLANLNWTADDEDQEALAQIIGSFRWARQGMSFTATDLITDNQYDIYLVFALGDDVDSRSMRVSLFGYNDVEDSVAIVDLPGGDDIGQGNPATAKVVSFSATPDESGNIWGQIVGYNNTEQGGYQANGAVLSAALVVGDGAITILRQPADQLVFEGQQAVFSLEVAGVADPVYSWYESRRGFQVGTGDTLIVNNVDVDDERYYYCVVTSEAIPGLEAISRQAALGVKRLRAHWSMDEADLVSGDYIDLSGEGNHIWENSYGFEVQFVDGVFGDAVMIDEYSGFGYMTEQFDPSAVTGQLTVSFWLNWNGPRDSTQTFVGKRNGTEWNDEELHWIICTGHNNHNLQFKNPRVERQVYDVLTDDGQWQHIAVTFDGELARIYVDAELRLEDDFELVNAQNAQFTLGALTTGGEWADGAMDDVKLWNYPLSHDDIAAIYYSGTGVRPCIDPVGDGADLTGDCMVTIEDISVLLQQWLEDGRYPDCLPDDC